MDDPNRQRALEAADDLYQQRRREAYERARVTKKRLLRDAWSGAKNATRDFLRLLTE